MDEFVFIDGNMSMGLKNTCKLFEDNFMKACFIITPSYSLTRSDPRFVIISTIFDFWLTWPR